MSIKKLKVLLFGDPLLRQKAKPVTAFHRKLHLLIDSMAVTLDCSDDGAALAAPQVGVLKRIVVINYEDEYLELVNPEIIDSQREQVGYEGCISLPGYAGMVTRSESVMVKYSDRYGVNNIIERNGNFARCLQHEIDHLDGILFIDRMTEKYLVSSDDKTKIPLDSVLEMANRSINKNSIAAEMM